MARIRSVKPETWSDQKLARLSRDARLLYISLWNFADEQGRMVGDPRQVKGMCLPMDDDLSPVEIDLLLDELAKAGRLIRYMVDDEHFLFLPYLAKHQRLDEKQESRFPVPPDDPAPPPHESGDSPEKSGELHSDPGEVQPPARAYVAGSREQVAGVPPSAGRAPATALAVVQLPTAQTLIAEYVDAYRARAGHDPPRDVKGQLAVRIKRALEDGVPFERVRQGLGDWFERDQHPATLPSFIEVAGRGGRPRASPTRAQQQREQVIETHQELEQWAERGDGDEPARVDEDRGQAQHELPRPGTSA
jgi:hypothetical protein